MLSWIYSGITGYQLWFQPCLHVCMPTEFTEPVEARATPYCEHADNEASLVDPCPSFHVLTIGLLRWTHTPSCVCPQFWPKSHLRSFGLYLRSHTKSFPWVCPLKPEFQHPGSVHTSRYVSQTGMCKYMAWALSAAPAVPCGDTGQLRHSPFQPLRLPVYLGGPPSWCRRFPGWTGYVGIFPVALFICDLLQTFHRYSVRTVSCVNVFLIYLWEEVSSISLYSAILIFCPEIRFQNDRVVWGTNKILLVLPTQMM